LILEPRRPFPAYLEHVRSSYFAICPNGNGIDSHRVWEALYLGTVPVVTRSVLTEQHPELPMVVLDDWSQFPSTHFSAALFDRLMVGWDAETLSLDSYLDRVETILGELRADSCIS
jgi:hypothetical protein